MYTSKQTGNIATRTPLREVCLLLTVSTTFFRFDWSFNSLHRLKHAALRCFTIVSDFRVLVCNGDQHLITQLERGAITRPVTHIFISLLDRMNIEYDCLSWSNPQIGYRDQFPISPLDGIGNSGNATLRKRFENGSLETLSYETTPLWVYSNPWGKNCITNQAKNTNS